MNKSEIENLWWAESYRPRTISDMIVFPEHKENFETYVKQGGFPHLLFTGSPGTGKTTSAQALCESVGVESIFVNASLEASIDLLRDKLSGFARTMSLDGESRKVVILDELDGVKSDAFFPALRPMMELYSQNCTFIGTANNVEKIPEAIRSRFTPYVFTIKDRSWYAKEIHTRCCKILDKEEVKYNPKIVATIIKKYFPDFRSILNALQQHQLSLTEDSLVDRLEGLDLSKLYLALKDKDFAKIRSIIQNDFVIMDNVYTQIYNTIKDHIEPAKIPEAIMILSDYNRDHALAIDKEIHVFAFLLQLARNVGPFK